MSSPCEAFKSLYSAIILGINSTPNAELIREVKENPGKLKELAEKTKDNKEILLGLYALAENGLRNDLAEELRKKVSVDDVLLNIRKHCHDLYAEFLTARLKYFRGKDPEKLKEILQELMNVNALGEEQVPLIIPVIGELYEIDERENLERLIEYLMSSDKKLVYNLLDHTRAISSRVLSAIYNAPNELKDTKRKLIFSIIALNYPERHRALLSYEYPSYIFYHAPITIFGTKYTLPEYPPYLKAAAEFNAVGNNQLADLIRRVRNVLENFYKPTGRRIITDIDYEYRFIESFVANRISLAMKSLNGENIEEDLKKLVEIDPTLYYYLAIYYARNGKLSEALLAIESASVYNPKLYLLKLLDRAARTIRGKFGSNSAYYFLEVYFQNNSISFEGDQIYVRGREKYRLVSRETLKLLNENVTRFGDHPRVLSANSLLPFYAYKSIADKFSNKKSAGEYYLSAAFAMIHKKSNELRTPKGTSVYEDFKRVLEGVLRYGSETKKYKTIVEELSVAKVPELKFPEIYEDLIDDPINAYYLAVNYLRRNYLNHGLYLLEKAFGNIDEIKKSDPQLAKDIALEYYVRNRLIGRRDVIDKAKTVYDSLAL